MTQLNCQFNQLTCIKALDTQVKTNWTKDASASYSETCTVGIEDEIIKMPKIIAHIYNIQGQEVSKYYTGLVIYQYTDGSTDKVVQQ